MIRFNSPPGWPTPPDGWEPTTDWNPDPSWPPAPSGWQFWVGDSEPRPAQMPGFVPKPRHRFARFLFVILGILIPLGVLWFIAYAAALSVDPMDYYSYPEWSQDVDDSVAAVQTMGLAGYLLAYALLARKVSYRWFDTFFQLIPIYGLFWQCRILWRISYLPWHDWPLRPEEKPWLEQLRTALAIVPKADDDSRDPWKGR